MVGHQSSLVNTEYTGSPREEEGSRSRVYGYGTSSLHGRVSDLRGLFGTICRAGGVPMGDRHGVAKPDLHMDPANHTHQNQHLPLSPNPMAGKWKSSTALYSLGSFAPIPELYPRLERNKISRISRIPVPLGAVLQCRGPGEFNPNPCLSPCPIRPSGGSFQEWQL